MTAHLDQSVREALEVRLRFYRDLGLTEFYRRPVDPSLQVSLEELQNPGTAEPVVSLPMGVASDASDGSLPLPSFQQEHPISALKTVSALPQIGAAIPAADRVAALQMIRDEIGDCTRCPLHKGRNKIVFADGSPNARLMFVGEGPGADEDAQGLPFVGRAGQLLNNMIAAMGLKREEVYIANVVKCRPPGNRTPEPEEANTCSPFLFRQIDVVRPQVLVALGATAATYLLGHRQPLAGLRGRVHAVRGTQLIVTYHPAYLLRDPRQKKEAWADLQIAMRELGLQPPGRG